MKLLSAFAIILCACAGGSPAALPAPAPTSRLECPAASPPAAKQSTNSALSVDVDDAKERVLGRLNARDPEGLFALFDPRMQELLPLEKARGFVERVLDAKGKLVAAKRSTGETSATSGSYQVQAERGSWRLELHLDPEGRIDGMKLMEPPPPDPAVEKSNVVLRLPFRDRFTVFWGGDRLELNHHVNHKSQRRAADLVVLGADGKTHSGAGKQNSDYHAWGKQVLAVADGKVVTVVDGVPNSEPGRRNSYIAVGNMVVIEHGPKLFSLVAHLQPGQIRVKVGQKVRAGAVLGLVGNSGNSSEPHLHFQLQDGPAIEASFGIEAVFERVRLERQGVKSEPTGYTFLKHDLIEPG